MKVQTVQAVPFVQNVLNGAQFESLTARRAIEGQRLKGWNVLNLLNLSPRQRSFAGNFIEQLDDLALARNLPHDFFLFFGHGRGGLLTG
jgi:hypothetical protein